MCSLAAHTFSLVNVYLRVLPILKVRLFALYPVVVFFFNISWIHVFVELQICSLWLAFSFLNNAFRTADF